MPLTREQAWDQLCSWTESEALRIHARSVEVVMRAAAYKYGNGESEVEAWGIAGLLHDADYDQWPEEHPRRIVAWLEAQGERDLAEAIAAHYTRWGRPAE
mgnify:CR=1 FL=1